jgi:hypothetical protein
MFGASDKIFFATQCCTILAVMEERKVNARYLPTGELEIVVDGNVPFHTRNREEARQYLKWYGASDSDLDLFRRTLCQLGKAEIVLTRYAFSR